MPEKTGNGNDKWMDVHGEVSNIKRKIQLVARSSNFLEILKHVLNMLIFILQTTKHHILLSLCCLT